MKRTGIAALASVVVCLLLGLNGLSVASATTLCKNNSSTELCTERYPASTEVHAALASGTTWVLNTAFKKIECKESEFALTVEGEGSSTETANLERVEVVAQLTSGCNCELVVLANPKLEIHSISGSDNGLVELPDPEVKSGTELTTWCNTIFGPVHCLYRSEVSATLTGGSPAKLDIEKGAFAFYGPTSMACTGEPTLEATYEITSPTPLYVASG